MFTYRFLLPHTYTIMKVREDPRKCTFAKGATASMRNPPNTSMKKKSAVLPRKDPSSSSLQYLERKNMWKTKSNPKVPKKKKFVKILQISYLRNTLATLKYNEKGEIRSMAHPTVVRKAIVR
mmetsp:Transcript_3372/g.21041  ORF Transcript_3372/g.21041 Transcript_3372/m.21041 type:complete len:122 (-) Transcript_3372:178-543(-)